MRVAAALAVVAVALAVAALACQAGSELPSGRVTVAGQTIDPAAWAEFLAPAWDEVRDLNEKLVVQSDDESDSVKLKQKAMASFDKIYRLSLKVGESFYLLAGFERLMGHLRYRTGRPADQTAGSETVA